jgi:NAD(P)-dependent dehydrogenase (short-subunit alcohol dehydrogenase family)
MSGVLDGKVCLIAGTSGIGGASALLFGSEGGTIVAVGRGEEHARELEEKLSTSAVEHLVMSEDLTGLGAAERIVAAACERFGRIDTLFHVAGISGRKFGDGPLHACTDAGWDTVMNVNLRAMFQLNRACIRHWLDMERPGVILNMASVLGFSFAAQHFDAAAYAATKGAIIAMSQHAAATYASQGIRINVIAPALVQTPMAARATQNPEIREVLKRRQPLTGAPLTDLDCARAALFLCSSASDGITGVVLPVDAGWCVSG